MNNIRVSIVCNTYNHGKYIEKALKGFISQKTNFSYEVLIHDDASTDDTVKIIRKYEALYPDIIKPIYQDVNQYSQKIGITSVFQIPRAQGDYIALCEGDDYWIDDSKLQKQFDLLENNPHINICGHAALKEKNEKIVGKVYPSKKKKIFSVEEVIINDGDFIATASLFCRKKIYEKTYQFRNISKSDYSLQILGSFFEGFLYIPDVMSVYRVQSDGSWSIRMCQDKKMRVPHFDTIIKMLEMLDIETNFIYNHVIAFQKAVYIFNKANELEDKTLMSEAKAILCSSKYRDCFKIYLPFLRKRKFIKYHFNWLLKLKKVL